MKRLIFALALLLPAPVLGQVSYPLKVTDGVTTCYPVYTLTCGTVTCSSGGATCGGGGSGTLTSVSQATGITLTPNPITTTGTVAVDQSFSPTWTGLHTFSKATTSVTSGAASAIASGASFTGDGGVGGNTATPIFLNLSPTVNLLATGGSNTSGYTGILFNVTETAIGSGTKKLLDLEVGGVSKMFVGSTGAITAPTLQTASGTNLTLNGVGAGKGVIVQSDSTTYMDFGITASTYVALASGISLAAAGGASSIVFGSSSGSTLFPTGNLTWNGAAASDANFTAASGGGGKVNISAEGNSMWKVLNGSLEIDSGTTTTVGASMCTALTTGRSGIRNSTLGMVNQTVGGNLSVTGNAIAITANIHHVGNGLIKNITVPATITAGAVVQLIPDSAFTYDGTGNIVVPAGGGTAVINKVMTVVWDGTVWTPSY